MNRCDWRWLRDKLRLRWTRETLEVFQDNAQRFKLDCARGFTLDMLARQVLRGERILASFDEIEHFVVEVLPGNEMGDTYRLRLGRIGKWDILIGDTQDQLECSLVAARMGTLTGKPVVARNAMA